MTDPGLYRASLAATPAPGPRGRSRRPVLRVLLLAFSVLPFPSASADKVGCYVSTGDNDWVWTSPPVNSEAGIEALFETLRTVYGVDRMYWRGTHAEWAVDHLVSRPEAFLGHAFWQWERHLIKEKGQSDLAVRAARKRGMEIWGINPLFDHGARAASDAAKMGEPAPIEHKLRVARPEVVPVDRYGLRRQAGPMEFAYPEVRKELIREYLQLLGRRGYDGMMFYTYVEHFALRFEDEYGYNQPIVDEFKKRYGQDIRTEPFDRHAWYRLRGEYVTRFLRELHEAFKQSGKKLGVAIDPRDSHLPAPWLCARGIRPTGRIYMDWETWVREGLVDEIMVWCNGSLEKALNDVLAVTAGTKVTVSTIHSSPWPKQHEHFGKAGVRRVMVGSYDYFEWGYKEDQPASAIDSEDFLKRLRVLRMAAEKKLELPLPRIIAATRDAALLVRRQAIRTLVELEAAEALPAIEERLEDEETAVRCTAAGALVELHGPQSVPKLFAALRTRTSFQFENAAGSTLANLPVERTPEILLGVDDKSLPIRRVTAYALGRGIRREEAVPALVRATRDPEPFVRFYAANALARFPGRREAGETLLGMLSDAHPSVRNRAALSLTSFYRSKSRWVTARQLAALRALQRCFEEACSEDDWSFRPVGNALLSLGPRGREALQAFMDQREDKRLADAAWRILHVKQNGWRYETCTEAEAEAGYKKHPVLAGWKPVQRTPVPPEPEWMPYLQQDFDALQPYASGKLGDYMREQGELRTLDATPPAPLIQGKLKRGKEGNAVRLIRGPAGTPYTLQYLRADYRLTSEQARVEFWVYRATEKTAFAVTWKDSGTSSRRIGIFISPAGRASVLGEGGKWVKTDGRMPAGRWQRIRFDIDGKKLRYSAYLGGEELQLIRADLTLDPGQTYNILTFSPQPPEGGTFYVDDVLVSVPNPAR